MAFTDNFNRASLGANWDTVEGTDWVTSTSTVMKPGAQYVYTTVMVVGTFPNDQYAEVWTETPVGSGDFTQCGPAVRVGATGDCYAARLTSTQITLYKRVSGTSSYLNDTPYDVVPGTLYKVRLTVSGTSLQVFVNGISMFTNTDADLSTGNPGCHALTGQTSLLPRFDDFESTEVVSVGGGSSIPVFDNSYGRRRRN